jgi:hypothetical protein
MYACSPEWEADWIPERKLEHGLSQLAAYIKPSPWGAKAISLNHGLHFTGGEPFLNYPLLLKAVSIATELAIPSLFVETNCYWCRSDAVTYDRLRSLRASGLHGIMVSVNPFYAEYVPFERTERCARISAELFGSNVFVYQTEYYDLFKQLGIQGRIAPHQCHNLVKMEDNSQRVEMFLMGRAVYQLRTYYEKRPPHAYYNAPCRPQFLRGWHNHFDNYGNLVPGYCGGLSLGNWFELDDLLAKGADPRQRPIVAFLVNNDMEGLVQFALDHGYRHPDEGYISKCDLCLHIRTHLASRSDFPDLDPTHFYQQVSHDTSYNSLRGPR